LLNYTGEGFLQEYGLTKIDTDQNWHSHNYLATHFSTRLVREDYNSS